MKLEDVLEFCSLAKNEGVEVWIDGGWGVDALLERQTRSHDDLDIVVQTKDSQMLVDLLKARGYQDVPRDDTCAWNFVLGDAQGHEIDFHVITLDEAGKGIYGPKERGIMYPASSLTGKGKIGNISVKCTSAEDLVRFHSGYQLDEKDYADVSALCEKFGIELPEEYEKFRKPGNK